MQRPDGYVKWRLKKKLISNNYSKALWIICRDLHVLPSDPNFKNLKPLQIAWLINNILTDKQEQEAYMKGSSGVSTSTVSVDDADFENLVNSRKPKTGR